MNKKAWLHILAALGTFAFGWFGLPALLSADFSRTSLLYLAGLQELVMFGLPAWLLYLAFGGGNKGMLAAFSPVNSLNAGLSLLSAVAFSLAGSLITLLMLMLLDTLGITPVLPDPIIPQGTEELLAALISLGILAPLFEELLFRGILLDQLGKKFGITIASWVTSLVFAIAHLNLLGFPLFLLIGLLLSRMRLRQKSLWLPVLFHMMYNTSILLMNYSGAQPGFALMLLCSFVFTLAIRPLLQEDKDGVQPSGR